MKNDFDVHEIPRSSCNEYYIVTYDFYLAILTENGTQFPSPKQTKFSMHSNEIQTKRSEIVCESTTVE